mmetsp:Transcript_3224/g.10122  ORF Transcript_3224/g.10122 Transcript_3224/m.10122 type:complete len:216 (+) Transcript_3224:677-1324(+)
MRVARTSVPLKLPNLAKSGRFARAGTRAMALRAPIPTAKTTSSASRVNSSLSSCLLHRTALMRVPSSASMKSTARQPARKSTFPCSRRASTQGWKIFSPTFPRHQRTSKAFCCFRTKKYAMPSAAAALHCSPGAKRPVRIIGSNASSYILRETPRRWQRSRNEILSYRSQASGESSNSLKASVRGAAEARSSGERLRNFVCTAWPKPVGRSCCSR